ALGRTAEQTSERSPLKGGASWKTLGAHPDSSVVAQGGEMWCGQACLENLGRRMGFSVTQEQATLILTEEQAIRKFGSGIGEGTTPDQLRYVLRKVDSSPGKWVKLDTATDPIVRANQLNDALENGPSAALLNNQIDGFDEKISSTNRHWVM